MKALHQLPPFARPGILHAIVEISAGTSMKLAYDPVKGAIVPQVHDGKPRRIEFLPYPGNYGFIPSTLMDPADGGDGNPLDVLILADYAPLGTLMEVIPVAILKLLDAGQRDDKLIAVPADPALRILDVLDLSDLQDRFPRVLSLVEEWFTHYDATQPAQALGWEDKAAALAAVEHWKVG
jgi:inorganic pyrophosphatase